MSVAPCAFCQPVLIHTTSSFLATRQLSPTHPSPYRQPFTPIPKRSRVAIRDLNCTFGNNSNNNSNDKLIAQIADALVAASRFFQNTTGQVLLWGLLVWLVVTGRIGFLFDSFIFLFALITIIPVIAMLIFRWWIGRQLVRGTCPSCGESVTGLRNQYTRCINCGNVVQSGNNGGFSVKDPSSATIDIKAKEVDDY